MFLVRINTSRRPAAVNFAAECLRGQLRDRSSFKTLLLKPRLLVLLLWQGIIIEVSLSFYMNRQFFQSGGLRRQPSKGRTTRGLRPLKVPPFGISFLITLSRTLLETFGFVRYHDWEAFFFVWGGASGEQIILVAVGFMP